MKHALVLLAVFSLCAGTLLAQEAQKDAPKAGKAKPVMLDRNIRLDFQMVPADADNQSLFVVTALSRFKVNVAFKGPDGEMELGASGEIVLRDDGRIFVVHETTVTFEGDQSHGHFRVSSGVILRPGEDLEVSRMGEKMLIIRATYVDGAEK